MSTISVLTEIDALFNRKDIPFLLRMRDVCAARKPYQNLNIYHNIPLTLESVLKVIPLVLGGAQVTVSTVQVVPPNKKAMDILTRAGIPIDLKHDIQEPFDVYLDCCAELASAPPPKLGTIELTATGTHIYKNLDLPYPVISVDDSELKRLESFGTGDGCIRAIEALTNTSALGKKFMVFGYGKIGQGLVSALKNYTDHILVIEKNPLLLKQLADKKITSLPSTAIDEIKQALKDTYCVIAVTAVKGFISKSFDKKDFDGVYLANLGADDEFGEKFNDDDVLFNKNPVNFAIPEPTTVKYLDPVLYAHNLGIDLLLSGQVDKKYHPFPPKLSEEIILEWKKIHE